MLILCPAVKNILGGGFSPGSRIRIPRTKILVNKFGCIKSFAKISYSFGMLQVVFSADGLTKVLTTNNGRLRICSIKEGDERPMPNGKYVLWGTRPEDAAWTELAKNAEAIVYWDDADANVGVLDEVLRAKLVTIVDHTGSNEFGALLGTHPPKLDSVLREHRCSICLKERVVNVFTCHDAPGACVNRICTDCIEEWIHRGAVCTVCRRNPGRPRYLDIEMMSRLQEYAFFEIMKQVTQQAEDRGWSAVKSLQCLVQWTKTAWRIF